MEKAVPVSGTAFIAYGGCGRLPLSGRCARG